MKAAVFTFIVEQKTKPQALPKTNGGDRIRSMHFAVHMLLEV